MFWQFGTFGLTLTSLDFCRFWQQVDMTCGMHAGNMHHLQRFLTVHSASTVVFPASLTHCMGRKRHLFSILVSFLPLVVHLERRRSLIHLRFLCSMREKVEKNRTRLGLLFSVLRLNWDVLLIIYMYLASNSMVTFSSSSSFVNFPC
jgi:hypothetical protein